MLVVVGKRSTPQFSAFARRAANTMDPEEAMWKHFYEKFQEQEKKSKETKNLTVHDIR